MTAVSTSPDVPQLWAHIRYETRAQGVTRIVLARADARNAQDKQMTNDWRVLRVDLAVMQTACKLAKQS